MKHSRRKFLKHLVATCGIILYDWNDGFPKSGPDADYEDKNLSDIFVARNESPQENVKKVLEMFGGVERLIGPEDIVIIKPNAQWWNQGRTNLAAMKGFIDEVLEVPGFRGEVIIGENNHFMNEELPEEERDNVRGWVRFGEINGEIDGANHNLNTLLDLYKKAGFKNVTKSHWRDGGPKQDIWGNGQKGGVVKSPLEGDGYVWSDVDYVFRGFLGFKEWKVKMSYPVFTSECSGITVDLSRGAFQRNGNGGGHFLEHKPVKLINFAALNDHGSDTGITGAVKNYMGIVDLSCGYWGLEPRGYANVHFCGERYYPYAKGGPLGHFMKTIRKADLNIITAEWVGWGSRVDPQKAARLQTILASTDAIGLDYYAAKHLVFPLSRDKRRHDPGNSSSSIRKFLELAAHAAGEGALDERLMRVHAYDFRSRS